MSRVIGMRPNPVHAVLHDALGIDSFALDGDDSFVTEGWQERPRVIARRL